MRRSSLRLDRSRVAAASCTAVASSHRDSRRAGHMADIRAGCRSLACRHVEAGRGREDVYPAAPRHRGPTATAGGYGGVLASAMTHHRPSLGAANPMSNRSGRHRSTAMDHGHRGSGRRQERRMTPSPQQRCPTAWLGMLGGACQHLPWLPVALCSSGQRDRSSRTPDKKVFSACTFRRGTMIDTKHGEPIMSRVKNMLLPAHEGPGQPEIAIHLHPVHNAVARDSGPWNWTRPGGYRDLSGCLRQAEQGPDDVRSACDRQLPGDWSMVNGKSRLCFGVKPRKYRFRLPNEEGVAISDNDAWIPAVSCCRPGTCGMCRSRHHRSAGLGGRAGSGTGDPGPGRCR